MAPARLTALASKDASSSMKVTQTPRRSRRDRRAITSRLRKSESSSVVELKISFITTMLRGPAPSMTRWMRTGSSRSLPRRLWLRASAGSKASRQSSALLAALSCG